MARQLTFDLPVRASRGRGDFFVSPSNAAALAALDATDWPQGKLLITGPKASGKTHLAHVWAEAIEAQILDAAALPPTPPDASAVVIEDLDRIAGDAAAEEAAFHLHNHALAQSMPLLMTGTGRPEAWPFTLPDLASRVAGTFRVSLEAPDDALLAAIMVKQFSDRQVRIDPSVLQYLLGRMTRSFAAANALVETLDAESLAEGRAITRKLAAKVLDNQGPTSP